MPESSNDFTIRETHGMLLRAGVETGSSSDQRSWTSLFASVINSRRCGPLRQRQRGGALTKMYPWEDVGHVADIGTAQGCVPVRLARSHPHLRITGFDLPPVEPIFSRFVAGQGVADRVRFTAGNFFRDPLPVAEVLIMGMILHDWDLATKRMLIGKAHAALPPGGSLMICEMLIDDERRTNLPGLLMSLNMLIETRGGFDFTGADCAGWLHEAGFSATRMVPLAGPYGAVIGTK